MTDEFRTPVPGALVEMPDGWQLAVADLPRALTDEKIIDIATRHRNHTLTAVSGARFDVIERESIVAFAREIERTIYRHQAIWQPTIYDLFGHQMAVHELDQMAGAA